MNLENNNTEEKLDNVLKSMVENNLGFEARITINENFETTRIFGLVPKYIKNENLLESVISIYSKNNEFYGKSLNIDLLCEYFSLWKQIRIDSGCYSIDDNFFDK